MFQNAAPGVGATCAFGPANAFRWPLIHDDLSQVDRSGDVDESRIGCHAVGMVGRAYQRTGRNVRETQ
jgi:hypothetical protein